MIDTKNIGGIYTLTNPYVEFHPLYVEGLSRCKNRYKTPMKKAKAIKKAKSQKRMSKQNRKRNR